MKKGVGKGLFCGSHTSEQALSVVCNEEYRCEKNDILQMVQREAGV